MKRRTALKTMGALVVCLGGHRVHADESTDELFISASQSSPVDCFFSADEIKNLIIERKGKPDLVIPFSEIVSALEEGR